MKNLIKEERAKKKITQKELAEKVNVSRQSIHAIESGKFVPSSVLALKISTVLQKNLEDIFTLEKID